jgi:iron-sulfur cluster assembly protein
LCCKLVNNLFFSIKPIKKFYYWIRYKNLSNSYKKKNCRIFAGNLDKINIAMIKVSDTASKKIVDMMREDGFDAAKDYVRVGVKSGGCSGLSYELKFDKELRENDKVFEDNNVKIAVEKKSFLYLAGTVLEFSGGLNGKGFVFNNPNASRTCGCGESFSL